MLMTIGGDDNQGDDDDGIEDDDKGDNDCTSKRELLSMRRKSA